MAEIITSEELTPDIVWALFRETDKKFAETDKKFQETDRLIKELRNESAETDKKFQQTDRRFKEIQEELGGIGKSNGEIAEDFFYAALSANMGTDALGMHFDYIDRNLRRKRKRMEAEYDIILYNEKKVLIVEVKYKFRMNQLRKFYSDKLKRFRSLFPEHTGTNLYGAIAAFTFENGVEEEAANFGFYIFTQNNDKIKLLNPEDFTPNEIR